MNDSTSLTQTPADGKEWLRRWDLQQEKYMARREERFAMIIDVIEAATGSERPLVLDLCCGPGSLAVRVIERIPEATVIALDIDPVLMLLGHRAYGDQEGRLRWVEADLRTASWTDAVAAFGPFDAVVSTTALHWLAAPTLASVYGAAAGLLAPDGVLVNGDHFFEPESPRLAELQKTLRATIGEEREEWLPWWEALEEAATHDSELAAAFALRATRQADHPEAVLTPPLDDHVAALRAGGLNQVGTVWQHGDDRVIVAMH